MKLYIWKDVLSDYTSGMVVVLAKDDTEAERVLKNEQKDGIDGWFDASEQCKVKDAEIIDIKDNTPGKRWLVWGGG